ncbi:hypothetical protein C874_14790 [Elizabethkingia anophelis 502]|nr:hypothetical protein C874_14790 [Elizabethkingia anophelis 502]
MKFELIVAYFNFYLLINTNKKRRPKRPPHFEFYLIFGHKKRPNSSRVGLNIFVLK